MTQYLSATDPGGSSGGTWVTRWIAPGEGQTVNIRPDASMNNPPVAIWTHGTKVEVNAPNSIWSEVRLYGSTTISGWVMTQYLSATDPGGSGGGTGTVYASVCTWPSTLTSAQRLSNVQYIYDFLRAQGFTKQAACGVLGNMETESNFNPGIWQSMNSLTLGYGLVQWDDATKFINRARDTGVISTATAAAVNALANNDPKALMDAELACLIWGCTSQGEFFYSSNYTTSGCSFTFSQYKASTLSAYTLGMAFHDHFERSAGGTSAIQARGDKALAWYNSL
jgi:hypothetical protein